ncbi:FMN-dependent NADPH-azoreductase [Actinomyces bovis]|uniref:FMN-dependent NADPH-azoreductase n=1 Tax=Actinomyces bovis TaxID=1658 RepID=A0ABY1VM32_9ACTO|nr:NAD(P)H-dependent oxidoreductase [Actinomyces bovis]SPT53156.1 FMN-dependent NADPH-azoreductase [Actinomyces bovis]VEG52335.1 FMN-dependent NADPH-azoreductase [Actinomyces israelii]
MTKIAVVLGSVRPNRAGAGVAEWVAAKANTVEGVEASILDIASFNLPFFAEEMAPAFAPAKDPAAVAWNQALAGFDAFIFVSPEYNFSVSGALKNAIDFITPSVLANRAIGLVGYSFSSGHRQIAHMRDIFANFTTGVVRPEINLHLASDFENMSVFKPAAFHEDEVPAMVQAILAQDRALATMR